MDYKIFSKKIENIFFLRNLKNILYWDTLFNMPRGSKEGRHQQIAALEDATQRLLESQDLSEFLYYVPSGQNKLDEWSQANINAFHNFKTNEYLPEDLAKKFSYATSHCENMWRKAKKHNNFFIVSEAFGDVLSILREIAEIKAKRLEVLPYEALMHKYDPNRKLEEQINIFSKLKSGIRLNTVNKSKYDKEILSLDISEEGQQLKIIKDIARKLGFSFDIGRLDIGDFSFCGGCPGDTRLIVKVGDNLFESLLSVIHEIGHGLYEQSLPMKYQNQPVGKARGLVFHEASALFFEMQIAKSKAFAKFLSEYLSLNYNMMLNYEDIYQYFISKKQSPIRVTSDEASYHYHIIIRFEIELALLNKEIEVNDIPAIWRQKYLEYLNIEIKDDKEGCLQDVHWFRGMFGYFPSYTNGCIIANMLFRKLSNEIHEFDSKIENGDFVDIKNYLTENFWSQGSKYNGIDTLHYITNHKLLDVDYYINYLNNKYLNI